MQLHPCSCWESGDKEGRQPASPTISTHSGDETLQAEPPLAQRELPTASWQRLVPSTLPKDHSPSRYQYRAVPRDSRAILLQHRRGVWHEAVHEGHRSAMPPLGMARGGAGGSADGAGPGVSSGEQQPPPGKIAGEELSISSECQKLPKKKKKKSKQLNPQGVLNTSLLTFFLQQPRQGTVPAQEPLLSAHSSSSGLQGRSQEVSSWRAESPLCGRACSHWDMVQRPLQRMLSTQARVSGPHPEPGMQEKGPTTF